MNLPSFNEWLLVKEGKKNKLSPEVRAFIAGKTTSVKLPAAPVARGHQAHISGGGAHKNKKAYDRKQKWNQE